MTEPEWDGIETQVGLPTGDFREDRYEAIELIVKRPAEGDSWFDRIFDFIASDCQGGPLTEDEDTEYAECTCGMESMGGMESTLDKCYARATDVGHGLQYIDLARTIIFLTDPERAPYVIPAERAKVIDWAHKEVDFEKYFEDKEWEKEEDETED